MTRFKIEALRLCWNWPSKRCTPSDTYKIKNSEGLNRVMFEDSLVMTIFDIRKARLDTLAERLRIKRKDVGWTQEQLAQKVGSSQAEIQKIENGKSLRPRKIDRIAEVLGTTPAWLMFGDDGANSLSQEAIELARAWSKLSEPHRSAHKRAIMKRASSMMDRAATG
jgi:transcriptional regulator with XRE-family HTH domain